MTTKSLLFCLLSLLLISLNSYSQNTLLLNGTIVDSLDHSPLASATVKLENNGKFVKGVLSSMDGQFKVEAQPNQVYVIKIEYIGYATKTVVVKATDISNLDLGALSLSPLSHLLETLIVTGLKPNMVTTLEKQVFDSEQFEVAKGGTAADALKNIPSVMINAEGEITVRGSKGFVIMVNGKPSAIDQATILSQIPANLIKSIEVISIPSARYEADGKAGIINIITKKGATDGLSIFTNLQYGLPRIKSYFNEVEPLRHGTDATIRYKKDKLEINTGLNYLRNDISGKRVGDAFTIIDGVKTIFPSVGERSFKRSNYGFRTNATYTINSHNELSGGLYLGHKEQYRKANILYTNSKVQASNSEFLSSNSYYNPNLVLKAGDFQVYNLDYLHTFENKSTLSFSGLLENAQFDGYTKNRNLNSENYADTLQYTLNLANNPLNA